MKPSDKELLEIVSHKLNTPKNMRDRTLNYSLHGPRIDNHAYPESATLSNRYDERYYEPHTPGVSDNIASGQRYAPQVDEEDNQESV